MTNDGSQTYDTNAGFWIEIIRNHRDKYREELTDTAVLKAVGTAGGLTALDAGCGEGYLSRKLAEEGAIVTGIDSSAELIKAARAHQQASALPTSFDIGTVDSLPYETDSFDLVLCNHLMNDLQDPAQALKEFARVLRDRGRVVILMLHPCFYNNHAERAEPENNLPTNSYFQTRRIVQNFEVDGLQSPRSEHSLARRPGVLHRGPARVGLRDHQPDRTASLPADDPGRPVVAN